MQPIFFERPANYLMLKILAAAAAVVAICTVLFNGSFEDGSSLLAILFFVVTFVSSLRTGYLVTDKQIIYKQGPFVGWRENLTTIARAAPSSRSRASFQYPSEFVLIETPRKTRALAIRNADAFIDAIETHTLHMHRFGNELRWAPIVPVGQSAPLSTHPE